MTLATINSKTQNGHGIPHTDVQQCKGLIYFDRLKMTWNCTKCQYTRGVYEWRQVYSHVRAVHGYTSRVPNGRWNIPFGKQYKPDSQEQEHNTTNPAMKMEIQTQRIIIQKYDNQPEWKCFQCDEHYETIRQIAGHIGKKNPEANTGTTSCPYCPMSFSNLENLKIHIRGNRCPNRHSNITPETWKDITKQNPILQNGQQVNIDIRNKPKPKRISIVETMEVLFERIKKTEDGQKWQCCTCEQSAIKPESLRGNLAIRHRETEPKNVYRPYRGKYFKRIGNLKQRVSLVNATKITKLRLQKHGMM